MSVTDRILDLARQPVYLSPLYRYRILLRIWKINTLKKYLTFLIVLDGFLTRWQHTSSIPFAPP